MGEIFRRAKSYWLTKINKRKIDYFRSIWGQESSDWKDPDLVEIFHLNNLESDNEVSDKTWKDLRLWDVFLKIDRTVSTIGRQILFHKLKTYSSDAARNNEFHKLVKYVTQNQITREKLQLVLSQINSTESYFLSVILEPSKDLNVKFPFVYHYLGNIVYLFPLILIFNPALWFIPLASAILNIIINWYFSKKMYKNFGAYFHLVSMANVSKQISKIHLDIDLSYFSELKRYKNTAVNVKKRIGKWLIDRTQLPEGLDAVFEYLNMLALRDFKIFLKANNFINENSKELKILYKNLGEIDAAISVASYLQEYNNFTIPEFNSNNVLNLKNIYHPLLSDPVKNSFSLHNKSLLITGSNMAGKTTMIKTVGINLIFARTLGFVLADEANIPEVEIMSSIKIEDNLDEGKSYYQVEVDDIGEFLKASINKKYCFLIDEIYRGTNTVERISASTAVLKQLAKGNIVLVTTHDIELQHLLNDSYKMMHFSECVEEENFYFDYLLKDGPCKTRNAIKLLELSGYPQEVVEEAMNIANNNIIHQI